MINLASKKRFNNRYKKPLDERSELPCPQKGMQAQFYDSDVDIDLAGSGAGTGKTLALLLIHTRHIDNSEYRGTIFRRTFSQITNSGSLLDESFKVYPLFDGVFNQKSMRWRFPSGATIDFRHLQHEKTKYEWQGAQITGLCFDELTHITESQFFYLLSRNRSVSGIKPFVRATCNPDADSWVSKLVQWYLDDNKQFPDMNKSGVIRYFVNYQNELIWSSNEQELINKFGENSVKSFTFRPGSIYENKKLIEANPEYLTNLENLHPVERSRLLFGDWRTKYESGTIFDRSWFEVINEHFNTHDLEDAIVIRFWDFAATEKEQAKSGTSYTVGCKMAKFSDNYYVILDLWFDQIKGGEVFNQVVKTGHQDSNQCLIAWEQEGGSSGKTLAETYQEKLIEEGLQGEGVKPMGNKLTRALPFATAAQKNKIKLIRAGWNDQFLNACQEFDGTHKSLINDIIDACDGAYAKLEISQPFIMPMFTTE